MPYIPKFEPVSLQEMAYAPALMRQQHDQAISNNMELADQLKFDYLKQDASQIEPALQGYTKDIQDISGDLAKFGFNNDIRNRIVGTRSKFIQDDKLDKYKKNYKTAMTGWEETKKGLMQQKASGRDVENMRNAYFGNYKGAFDNEGMYQEFTPGATSGVYDLAEDTKKALTGIGTTGHIVGHSGTSVDRVESKDRLGNPMSYFSVTDSKTGQRVDNLDQRQATALYLKHEYGDANTDRGLYAKISGWTPDYIDQTIDQVSQSMKEDRYAQLPQTDTNISGINADPTGRGSRLNQPLVNDPSQYKFVSGDTGAQPQIDHAVSVLSKGFSPDGSFNPQNIKDDDIGYLNKQWAGIKNAAGAIAGEALNIPKDILGMPHPETSGKTSAQINSELKSKTREEAGNLWNKTITKYKSAYDYFKNNKGTDIDFFKFVNNQEQASIAKNENKYGLDDPDAVKMALDKLYESGDIKSLIEVKSDGTDGKEVSQSELQGTGKDKFVPTGQVIVDKYGTMTFNANGKQYKINKSALPEQAKVDNQDIDDMTNALTNYQLSTSKLRNIKNNKRWNIGGFNVKVDVDPNNPVAPRHLMVEIPDEKLGRYVDVPFGDPASVQKYITGELFKRISYEPYKKAIK